MDIAHSALKILSHYPCIQGHGRRLGKVNHIGSGNAPCTKEQRRPRAGAGLEWEKTTKIQVAGNPTSPSAAALQQVPAPLRRRL
eukprot:852734-Pelagomonas_calceolata.AAC.8